MKVLPHAPMPPHCPHCGCRMVARNRRGKQPWEQCPTRDHILPREWGGRTTPDNLRWCCRRCNQNRVYTGHCVGALACVYAVAKSSGRSTLHVTQRWRLQRPVRPRPPWPRAGDNPHLAQGGVE